jgi:hypothetical protein
MVVSTRPAVAPLEELPETGVVAAAAADVADVDVPSSIATLSTN